MRDRVQLVRHTCSRALHGAGCIGLCLQTGPVFPLLRTNNRVEHQLSHKGGGRKRRSRHRKQWWLQIQAKKKMRGTRHSSSLWQSQHLGRPRQEDCHELRLV